MNKYFTIGSGIGLVLLSLLCISMYQRIPKTAYVSTQIVFADFAFTQEIEAKLSKIKAQRNQTLDSLKAEVQQAYQASKKDDTTTGQLERLQEEYFAQEAYFEEDHQQLVLTYNKQVWKQLNQYVQEYGEQQGYQYIYGTKGDGNLMYAQASEDITEQIVAYANARYEGDL